MDPETRFDLGGGADGTGTPDEPGASSSPPDGTDDPGSPDTGGNSGQGPQGGPAKGGPGGRACPGKDTGPSISALVNITVPLAALAGDTGAPGEAAGFGILDHQGSRDLAAAAARHPKTRWCVTVLNPDGTAAAHGCAPGRRALPDGTGPQDLLSRLGITVTSLARGPRGHHRAETGYHPSRALEHLVNTRNTRCTALPYEAYERYEALSRQRARLDSALASAQSVQAELPGPFSPDHDREVAAYVDGEISAAELYRRTVARYRQP